MQIRLQMYGSRILKELTGKSIAEQVRFDLFTARCVQML